MEETGITYYNLVRIYNDGGRISLNSNNEWASYVSENIDKFSFPFEELPNIGGQNVTLWDLSASVKDSCAFKHAKEFNISHGITVINVFDNYIEYNYFGTTNDNHDINNFYINNMSLLNSFILETLHYILLKKHQKNAYTLIIKK